MRRAYIQCLRRLMWNYMVRERIKVLHWGHANTGSYSWDLVEGVARAGGGLEEMAELDELGYRHVMILPKDRDTANVGLVLHELCHHVQIKRGLRNKFLQELSAYAIQWAFVHWMIERNPIRFIQEGMNYSMNL